jgi:eukaryotic-like serine/threonine-protein kinase
MASEFEYKKELGSGYFGKVWLAVDKGLNCECALKCIPQDKLINKGNFYYEAQILKAATHSNIIKVTETGEFTDKTIYVVMEYLKRGSVGDEVVKRYMCLSRARRLMIDVLRGLEYAHSKNIIHRDIKPANILIGNSDEGVLSDFGLSFQDLPSADLTPLNQKYQYMLHLAPEVKEFKDYTKLSDIYACGMTLYRLVNGDSFLPMISPQGAHLSAKLGKFPDRNKYRDFIPKNLKILINKALNVDPTKRFQSASEMRHALEKVAIYADWEESETASGKQWICEKHSIKYLLQKDQNLDGKWTVTFSKGKSTSKMKKIKASCGSGLSLAKATACVQKVLQELVKTP